MSNNSNLHKAKKAKDDEFYTLYETVEKEIPFYKEALKGKIIYCPCDDYRESNFVKYLKDNFQGLGLKELISTNYDTGKGAWKYTYDGTTEAYEELQGNGDYNSSECISLRDSADVIITNPPFSRFRDFYSWAKVKNILLVCTINVFTYKDIFLDLYAKKVWPGCSMIGLHCLFRHNNGHREINGVKYTALNNAAWMTNMIPENYTPPKLALSGKTYNSTDYPKYDNYDAIEVSKVKDIPVDYEGVMGVPITILKYLDPKTFTLVDGKYIIKGAASSSKSSALDGYVGRGYINGKSTFARLMIKEGKKNGNS